MTHDQREIHRKKRILEYAERVGNINKTCRYFGVARSTFYLSVSGMVSTDFRTGWDGVQFIRIATRSRFPATTCKST